MARMPGARWRPLANNWAAQPRMSRYDLVIIHTAVGSFEGTFSWFANSGGYIGAESHFMTSAFGDIDQYQDTAHQAEANGAANPKAISTENADMGPGFKPWNTSDARALPPLTPAQIEANARICAWAHLTHGIPLVLVPDSKPGRRGIAYHRLGVPGYAVAGGELWSTARGKVCPADPRIAQIPQIIARAKQIAAGQQTTPAPAPEVPDMLPHEAKQLADIHRELTTRFPSRVAGSKYTDTAVGMILNTDAATFRTEQMVTAQQATIKGLVQTIAALAANGDDVDVDALVARIGERIDTAVSDAAKLVKVQVSVDDAASAT